MHYLRKGKSKNKHRFRRQKPPELIIRNSLRVLYLTFGVIFVDQFTKLYIKGIEIPFLDISFQGMHKGESISVIGDFFKITFIENPGMAFGFNPGSDFKLWISIFSLIASIGLLVYLFSVREKSLSLRIAIAFILGGAIGNLIDRMFYGIIFKYAPVFYGRVVDFFDFDFFNFSILGRSYDRWPIFNVADSAVTIGILILILFYKRHKEEDEEQAVANLNETSAQSVENDEAENISSEPIEDDKTDKGKEISN